MQACKRIKLKMPAAFSRGELKHVTLATHVTRAAPCRQRGAVLIVGLVMLTVMTMLVVSMMKTSIIDLKIGGLAQDAMVNFNNAEISVGQWISQNSLKLSNNCITAPGALNCNAYTAPTFMTGYNVTIAVLQVYCGDQPGFTGNQVGVTFQTAVFDAIATATSNLGSNTRLHIGIAQDLPPGACSI